MTYKIQELVGDERAVSPVIGVILMVAITVILAAVIGTFVLDLGQSAGQSAPQASLSVTVSTSSDNVTVEHTGGDAIDAASTRVIIENSNGSTQTYDPATNSDTLTVGGSVEFNVSHHEVTATQTWDGLSGGSDGFGIESGQTITVTIIDTESQRQIFETSVTG